MNVCVCVCYLIVYVTVFVVVIYTFNKYMWCFGVCAVRSHDQAHLCIYTYLYRICKLMLYECKWMILSYVHSIYKCELKQYRYILCVWLFFFFFFCKTVCNGKGFKKKKQERKSQQQNTTSSTRCCRQVKYQFIWFEKMGKKRTHKIEFLSANTETHISLIYGEIISKML